MNILDWLLKGDVSVVYQVNRDLLHSKEEVVKNLQLKIATEGFGHTFLNIKENNHIGLGIYSPKWVSLHYTLFDLYCIGVPPTNRDYIDSATFLLNQLWFNNGVVRKNRQQDVCICGMLLSICCYGGVQHTKIEEMIDYLIDVQYLDGGWNCLHHLGHPHSSLHTTLSVLEGLDEYIKNGYTYKIDIVKQMIPEAQELLLRKELYKRETTKTVIRESFLNCPFPFRWYYDILRNFRKLVDEPIFQWMTQKKVVDGIL